MNSNMINGLNRIAKMYKDQIATTPLVAHMKNRMRRYLMRTHGVPNIEPRLDISVSKTRKIKDVQVSLPVQKPMKDPLLSRIMHDLEDDGGKLHVRPVREGIMTYERERKSKLHHFADSQYKRYGTAGLKSVGPPPPKPEKQKPKKKLWKRWRSWFKKLFQEKEKTPEQLREEERQRWRKSVAKWVTPDSQVLCGFMTSDELAKQLEEEKKKPKKWWQRCHLRSK